LTVRFEKTELTVQIHRLNLSIFFAYKHFCIQKHNINSQIYEGLLGFLLGFRVVNIRVLL
jgi:hypothetical protein